MAERDVFVGPTAAVIGPTIRKFPVSASTMPTGTATVYTESR